jgi:hypothetical protein
LGVGLFAVTGRHYLMTSTGVRRLAPTHGGTRMALEKA